MNSYPVIYKRAAATMPRAATEAEAMAEDEVGSMVASTISQDSKKAATSTLGGTSTEKKGEERLL